MVESGKTVHVVDSGKSVQVVDSGSSRLAKTGTTRSSALLNLAAVLTISMGLVLTLRRRKNN